MFTQEELYRRYPHLEQHHKEQIERVRIMQEKPVNWEAIDRQIELDFICHGLKNPNKKHEFEK